jgi:hypothetical protein
MCRPPRNVRQTSRHISLFPLPPVLPPIGDTSFIHVMRPRAHSTTSPTPTVMGQSFIIIINPVVMIFAMSFGIMIQRAVGNEPCYLIK